MAKGKKKAGKKADRLPKEIAGVRVPKDLRRPAARARQLVEDHPIISEAVAAGMLAAAAALMGEKGGRKAKNVLKAAATAAGGRLMAEAKNAGGIGGKVAALASSRTAAKPAAEKALPAPRKAAPTRGPAKPA